MTPNNIFREIHRLLLDYTDDKIIERSAEWGLKTFNLLEQHGLIITASDNERGTDFIYAVTTAVIVGEFGNFCFDDSNSDETEIELGDVGLELEDIREYLNENIDEERLEELRRMNYISIQDIWDVVQEWKTEIHRALLKIYTKKDTKDTNDKIFYSLKEIFEQAGEEPDEIMAPYSNFGQDLDASEYVRAGFQY